MPMKPTPRKLREAARLVENSALAFWLLEWCITTRDNNRRASAPDFYRHHATMKPAALLQRLRALAGEKAGDLPASAAELGKELRKEAKAIKAAKIGLEFKISRGRVCYLITFPP